MKVTELKKTRMQLASRLYQVRTKLGITQMQLQKEGIISQSHLSKIENGEINVSAIMLYHLATYYGKDLNFFFE